MSERIRLRHAYSPEQLAEIYPVPHDHTRWEDHRLRVAVTAAFARTCAGDVQRAADLSCGDGAILWAIRAEERLFGDFAPGWPITGPIERTIGEIEPVDVFVCCETVEHLDDPDGVLAAIRRKTRRGLVLSTPVGAFDDGNPEHYHAWDREAVEEMLGRAGFHTAVYGSVDFTPAGPYEFGLWFAT